MPIYAYRCADCGYAKDVLQKMSDDPLSVCPGCGASSFTKQLTAAGFQLKGSGWYVTDFRGGNAPKAAESGDAAAPDAAKPQGDKPADMSADKSADKTADKTADKPAVPATDKAAAKAGPAPAAAKAAPSPGPGPGS